jgi:hypothetical protein
VRLRRGSGGVGAGASAQKAAFWRKSGGSDPDERPKPLRVSGDLQNPSVSTNLFPRANSPPLRLCPHEIIRCVTWRNNHWHLLVPHTNIRPCKRVRCARGTGKGYDGFKGGNLARESVRLSGGKDADNLDVLAARARRGRRILLTGPRTPGQGKAANRHR